VPESRNGRPLLAICSIVGIAFVARLWWAFAQTEWSDPDGYLWYARQLADGTHFWRWTPAAVQYAEFYKAPLYQVILSAFTAFPDALPMPAAGFVLHALLNSLTVFLLFEVGCELHSNRAGLLAAVIFAFWLPNIRLTTVFWQEHLHLPLLVAGFALLGRSLRTQTRSGWIVTGVVFGFAALARSSVGYFVLPAAFLCAAWQTPRVTAVRFAAWMVIAFAIVTIPYSIFISRTARQPIFIENIGAFTLKRPPPSSEKVYVVGFREQDARAPTGLETLRLLRYQFSRDKRGFIDQRLELLRLLLKPPGTVLLPALGVDGQTTARVLKTVVHAVVDVPFVLMIVFAPFGVIVARSFRFATLLTLWVFLLLTMLALTLWAGMRFRAPVEPALMVLGAAFLSGNWRSFSRASVLAAGCVSLAAAVLVAFSLPAVVAARANYGTAPWHVGQSTTTSFLGSAGINVAVPTRELIFALRPTQGAADRQVALAVFINGSPADRSVVRGTPRLLRYKLRAPGVVYLEVFAFSGTQPVAMFLDLPQGTPASFVYDLGR
jgi:4-amino-4-deoxy-L-arabinose transferase-like glycosyltransferase